MIRDSSRPGFVNVPYNVNFFCSVSAELFIQQTE